MRQAIARSESYEAMLQCIQRHFPQILADETQMTHAIEALEKAWGYTPCKSHIRRRMAQYLYFSYLPIENQKLHAYWQWKKCEKDAELEVSTAHNAFAVCAALSSHY